MAFGVMDFRVAQHCAAVVIVAAIFFVIGSSGVWAQVSSCFEGDRARARDFAEARKKSSVCKTSCRGCGCKGGPGYRGPDGKCVGYKNLNRVCGPPPHAKCVRECHPVTSDCTRPTEAEATQAREERNQRRKPCKSGYRRANGRCVGVAKLQSVCGTPPTARCSPDSAKIKP